MRWTVRLEAGTSQGEVKTTELVTFSRPAMISALAEVNLMLAESRTLVARLQASMLSGLHWQSASGVAAAWRCGTSQAPAVW